MVDEIHQLASGQEAGEGVRDRSCFKHAQGEDNPFGRVRSTEANVVTWVDSHFDEACCDPVRLIVYVSMCHLNVDWTHSRPIGKEKRSCFQVLRKIHTGLSKKFSIAPSLYTPSINKMSAVQTFC